MSKIGNAELKLEKVSWIRSWAASRPGSGLSSRDPVSDQFRGVRVAIGPETGRSA